MSQQGPGAGNIESDVGEVSVSDASQALSVSSQGLTTSTTPSSIDNSTTEILSTPQNFAERQNYGGNSSSNTSTLNESVPHQLRGSYKYHVPMFLELHR